MEFYGYSNEEYDTETVYDFNTERPLLKVFGMFAIIKHPRICSLLNLAFFICIVLLHTFLISMAIYTIYLPSTKRETKILDLEFLFIMACAVFFPMIKMFTFREMDKAMKILKNGVFKYSNDWKDEELSNIMKKRVKQIRFFSYIAGCVFYISVIPSSFQYPLTQLLIKEKNTDYGINPYLPIPIYLPYSTDDIFSFCVASLSESLFYFLFYSAITCHMDIYLGMTLQLVAQIEILNRSLGNIEKRAYSKFTQGKTINAEFIPVNLYSNKEFQECMYFCLRENVLHHRAILRYTAEIRRYVEAVNTVCIAVFGAVFALSAVPVLENPIKNAQLMTIVVGETIGYFLVSWLGQHVIDKSSEIFPSLYSTPWYYTNKKFRVLLSIMLSNVRNPIFFYSRGIKTTAGLENFADMISLAYKLMNVLMKQS